MSRVKPVTKEEAKNGVKEIYQVLEKKMGKIPNIFLNMGQSHAVLKAYMGLGEAANLTTIDPKVREEIALTVAQANDCHYCLSAHSAIAKSIGINEQTILQARLGQSQDPKTQAILRFSKLMVDKRGHLSDQEVDQLKKAGVSDTELVEIILVVIQNMFTNYFNHITDPAIDFPVAPELAHKH